MSAAEDVEAAERPLQDHLIVCGFGQVGYRVAQLLLALGEPFVILSREVRSEWGDFIEQSDIRLIQGDARAESCLREAGIETAKGILIVTSHDLVNIQIASDAQRLNPKIGLIVRVFDRDLAERIGREMGIRDVLSPALLTAPVFIAAAMGEEMLRSFTIGGCDIDILRMTVTDKTPGIGEMLDEFCARRDLVPLALLHGKSTPATSNSSLASLPQNASILSPLIAADAADIHLQRPLAEGDELVVATVGAVTERLRKGGYLPAPVLPTASKAPNVFRALGNQAWKIIETPLRALRRGPILMKIAFYALLAFIALSIAVFHFALPLDWIDSLYFVVSIITTVGFGDFNLHSAAWWLKLFGCFVMFSGAALVAIVFGLMTDFIVSARVDQALGRRQSHLRGHLVVVGLGDTGSRVIESLRRMKQPVIAIERQMDQEAAPGLTDDLYVIVGDANRPRILEQANVAQARAIIVTTANDLDNVRIAHQAERLQPRIRSVVRITDSLLASKLVDSLNIDRAINAAETAAATFVGCTINKHTEHGFLLGSRLFLLRWMLPEEASRLGMVGASIRELREQGAVILLKRTGTGQFQQTRATTPSDLVEPGCFLLVLEEYNPHTRMCEAPTIGIMMNDE